MADNLVREQSAVSASLAIRKPAISLGSVLSLFCAGCPSAISGLVVSVVVDAINGVQGSGHGAHVAEERCKRRVPFVTDAYPSAAISMECSRGRVLAAVPHGLPNSVFAAARLPIKRIRRFFQAPATKAVSGSERSALNLAFDAARAPAKVVANAAISAWRCAAYIPIAKGLTSLVDAVVSFAHAYKYSTKMKLYGR